MEFHKYHGTGNDFIIIDNRKGDFRGSNEIIEHLCHRRFGIGADGLMLLENSQKYDFHMRYFNSDGMEGSMCGNGGRCITAFAKSLGLIESITCFEAVDGLHKAFVTSAKDDETGVKLSMKDVKDIETGPDYFFLDTGSPHYVKFISGLDTFDVVKEGRAIRSRKEFGKKGTNVNFVEIRNNSIYVRSYERGVENETFSCGTGVTASAIAFSLYQPEKSIIPVDTLGGKLIVSFCKSGNSFTEVSLEGPARFVFKGDIHI